MTTATYNNRSLTDIFLGLEDEIYQWVKESTTDEWDWDERPSMEALADYNEIGVVIEYMIESLGDYKTKRTLPCEFEEVLWNIVHMVGTGYGNYTFALADLMYSGHTADCWERHGDLTDEGIEDCYCTLHNKWHYTAKEPCREWEPDGSGCTDAAIARVAAKKAQAQAQAEAEQAQAEAEAAMGMYI